MKGLIAAIQFLTILPAGKSRTFDPPAMIPCFPLAGLLIGLLLSLCDMIFCHFWSRSAASVLDMIFLIWISGALHLDGLADTADGLYGHRSRERSLEIMKDSRIGSMALVAVICALAAKCAGISEITDSRSLFMIIIPAYARSAMLFGFCFLEYGRTGQGTGEAFFQKKTEFRDFRWMGILFFLSLMCGWKALILNAVFVFIIIIILHFYKKRMGCITGDMLGAMAEITESALFMAAAAGVQA